MQNGELQKVLKKVEALFKHQFAQTIELKWSESNSDRGRKRERKVQQRKVVRGRGAERGK